MSATSPPRAPSSIQALPRGAQTVHDLPLGTAQNRNLDVGGLEATAHGGGNHACDPGCVESKRPPRPGGSQVSHIDYSPETILIPGSASTTTMGARSTPGPGSSGSYVELPGGLPRLWPGWGSPVDPRTGHRNLGRGSRSPRPSQPLGHRPDVDAGRQQLRSVRVPQVMEPRPR